VQTKRRALPQREVTLWLILQGSKYHSTCLNLIKPSSGPRVAYPGLRAHLNPNFMLMLVHLLSSTTAGKPTLGIALDTRRP
jgi:hypothetical protein